MLFITAQATPRTKTISYSIAEAIDENTAWRLRSWYFWEYVSERKIHWVSGGNEAITTEARNPYVFLCADRMSQQLYWWLWHIVMHWTLGGGYGDKYGGECCYLPLRCQCESNSGNSGMAWWHQDPTLESDEKKCWYWSWWWVQLQISTNILPQSWGWHRPHKFWVNTLLLNSYQYLSM